MKIIDDFLNSITMYRLLLYILITLLVWAVIFSFFGLIPYSPISIILSSLFLVAIGWAANTLFAKAYKASTNIESVYITVLILALIISPAKSPADFAFLGWAAVLAMASKYLLAINKKHIFNPAAIAVVITSFAAGDSASWWVGNAYLAPLVIFSGFLIVRKIQREDLLFSFLGTVLLLSLGYDVIRGINIFDTLNLLLFHSSLPFFATVMLTEPLTTPPTKGLRSVYGVLTGVLYFPQVHLGSIYSTPELALVIGNIFSYIVSPKVKMVLSIEKKIRLSPDVVDFVFNPSKRIKYRPGQYMEWTLAHSKPDSRGNRRYFTLASSPTENDIRLGVKFHNQGSSFKQALFNLGSQGQIVATGLAGDFTLPKDKKEKLVLIAGGIGITPYRSMIRYLLDKNEPRDIVLIYSNKKAEDIVYKETFDQAKQQLGINTFYTITETEAIPVNWRGMTGRIDAEMVKTEIPDYLDRTFYLSGPKSMVDGFENTLKGLGVSRIKKDFFPGFV